MKNLFYYILIILISYSCSSTNKTIEFSKLENRDGIYLKIETKKPYTGTAFKYYKKGDIVEMEAKYKDGKLDGLQNIYSENGNLFSKSIYKDGELIERYDFFKNGKMKSEFQIRDDNSVLLKSYYESGKLWSESLYIDKNLHNGSGTVYYESGSIKEVIHYENNKIVSSEKFEK